MPPWAAAATHKNHIELQPVSLLKQRGILETTLRHELVHVVVEAVGGKQTPRWLAERLALYIAGEGKLLERYAKGPSLTVRDLVRVEGENKLWQRVAQRSYDVSATAR